MRIAEKTNKRRQNRCIKFQVNPQSSHLVCRVNTGKRSRCRTHLLGTYFIAGKFVSVSECNTVRERYHSCDLTVIKQAKNYQTYLILSMY